tara:strand:+ start:222 stop:500 length:279 start_codon:yes stop_codon:yes gene_type:complete
MIKVGIMGVGHLGEIHLKLISNSKLFTLVGFYDNNQERATLISEKYNVISYTSYDDLCNDIDAVIICTPTPIILKQPNSFSVKINMFSLRNL